MEKKKSKKINTNGTFGLLVGLEGVKRKKELPAFFISNVKDISKAIKQDLGATACGDNGAINAYIDDDGFYRFEALNFCIVVEKKIFTNIKLLQKEFSFWLKKIK